jgi:hypothetical protein
MAFRWEERTFNTAIQSSAQTNWLPVTQNDDSNLNWSTYVAMKKKVLKFSNASIKNEWHERNVCVKVCCSDKMMEDKMGQEWDNTHTHTHTHTYLVGKPKNICENNNKIDTKETGTRAVN